MLIAFHFLPPQIRGCFLQRQKNVRKILDGFITPYYHGANFYCCTILTNN